MNELKNKSKEIIQRNKKEKKHKKESEEILGDLWDSFKWNNVCVISFPEEERKKWENLFKQIMAKNFPTLGMEIDIRIQTAEK